MSHGVVQAAIKVAKMYKHNTGVGKKLCLLSVSLHLT